METPNNTSEVNSGSLDIIVVGAGFGGLTTAIECHRRGHSVTVYESFAALKPLGDIISFGANAGRIFHRWNTSTRDEKVSDLLAPHSIDLSKHGFTLNRYDGTTLMHQHMPPQDPKAPMFNGHRGALHAVVYEYAVKTLNIPICLGSRVHSYFETSASAGIVLESGDKHTADVVIAADGVNSKAREFVLQGLPQPSALETGHMCLRAWFKSDAENGILSDEATKGFAEDGDTFTGWIGKDVHFLFSTLNRGTRDCSWALTYRPATTTPDSSRGEDRVAALSVVKDGDWDPVCAAIVEKTPSDAIISWRSTYRHPLPRWVSSGGRVALVGDSAHSMLPTSAQGAAQAMEDGVTVAVCLSTQIDAVLNEDRIPWAMRAYQEIRQERVAAVQETGEKTRKMWHDADWAKARKDPSSLNFPREDWIHGHDAETYAEEMAALIMLQSGEA